MLPIPYGTKHTVTITANIWKPIRCHHCGCEFAFRKAVTVAGEGTNLLWLSRSAAIAGARSQAMQNLERAIGNISGNFPCPQCGMFQPEMASEIERETAQARRLATLGISVATILALAFALNALLPATAAALLSIAAYSFALLIAIAVGLWYARSRPPFTANALAATRKGQEYSEEYPVLRKSDLERLVVRQTGANATPNIVLPWPTPAPGEVASA